MQAAPDVFAERRLFQRHSLRHAVYGKIRDHRILCKPTVKMYAVGFFIQTHVLSPGPAEFAAAAVFVRLYRNRITRPDMTHSRAHPLNNAGKLVSQNHWRICRLIPAQNMDIRCADRRGIHCDHNLENTDAKGRIAAAAAKLIHAGASIILDGGSTVGAMGQYLQKIESLTVITPSLYCAEKLRSPNLSVLIPGGVLLQQDFMLFGPDCEAYFKNIIADFVFVGASGIRSGRGITIVSPLQYSIKKVMLASARKTVVLVDHTKFSKDGLNLVADFKDIDILITDLPIEDPATLHYLEKVGTEVIYTG